MLSHSSDKRGFYCPRNLNEVYSHSPESRTAVKEDTAAYHVPMQMYCRKL